MDLPSASLAWKRTAGLSRPYFASPAFVSLTNFVIWPVPTAPSSASILLRSPPTGRGLLRVQFVSFLVPETSPEEFTRSKKLASEVATVVRDLSRKSSGDLLVLE